ncbi:hypothetical protein [Krasilnikovia sp. MM14-A1259]
MDRARAWTEPAHGPSPRMDRARAWTDPAQAELDAIRAVHLG